MLVNYFKSALRNIKRNKVYASISILGLALGIGSLFFILVYIRYETSFDNFHDKQNRIYRLVVETNFSGQTDRSPWSYAPLGPDLQADYPQIESVLRLRPVNGILKYQDKQFEEDNLFYADSSFFDIFSFPLKEGDPTTALRDPYTMVITERMAHKYFGDADPLNKTIRFNNDYDLRVTGVLDDIPENSHLQFEGLISFETAISTGVNRNFGHAAYYTYLLLVKHARVDHIEADSPDFIARHFGEQYRENFKLYLQPLRRIHLHSYDDYGFRSAGNYGDLLNLLLIGILIILVASINYTNLAIAASARRAHEVGMRRTLGAFRRQLVAQFLGESLTLAFLALLVPIILTEVLLPYIGNIVNKDIIIGLHDVIPLAIMILSITLVIGILSGLYPAFVFARIPVISALKGTYRANPGKSRMRQLLIIFQFTISIILIVGTIVVYHQIKFMKNADPGFDAGNVVVIPFGNSPLRTNWEAFENELRNNPSVLGYTASSSYPGGWLAADPFVPEGSEQNEHRVVNVMRIDHSFLDTYGIPLAKGREFLRQLATDPENSILINESAVKAFGWDSAVGKKIEWTARGSHTYTVIGVVKDFHYQTFRDQIAPLCLQLMPEYNYLSVKIRPEDRPAALAFIENTWRKFAPNYPFDYFNVDDKFASLYGDEEQKMSIIGTFSFLAIFIACLGVFGLTSFEMVKRTKEIGIRKVFGASNLKIFLMLSLDMCKPILIAIIIGCPIAYYVMNRWLESYAYRIPLGWSTFALAGITVFVLAFLTVSYQSARAAMVNPAATLRSQ